MRLTTLETASRFEAGLTALFMICSYWSYDASRVKGLFVQFKFETLWLYLSICTRMIGKPVIFLCPKDGQIFENRPFILLIMICLSTTSNQSLHRYLGMPLGLLFTVTFHCNAQEGS